MKILKITLCILLGVILCSLISCKGDNNEKVNSTQVTTSQVATTEATTVSQQELWKNKIKEELHVGMTVEEIDEVMGFEGTSHGSGVDYISWSINGITVTIVAHYDQDIAKRIANAIIVHELREAGSTTSWENWTIE